MDKNYIYGLFTFNNEIKRFNLIWKIIIKRHWYQINELRFWLKSWKMYNWSWYAQKFKSKIKSRSKW